MCNKPGTQDNSQKRSAQKMPRCFQRFRTMITSSYTTNSFTQGSQDLYESPLNSINIYKQHDRSFCSFPKHHFSLGLHGVSPWDPSSIPYQEVLKSLGKWKHPNSWGVRGCSSPARWYPRSIAKLVNITPITMVFVGDISIVNGIINQLITGGAPSCVTHSHWNGLGISWHFRLQDFCPLE